MNILEIIEHKRDKKELSKEELEFFVQGYTKGKIADYQASSLIMAMYINGNTDQEITDLTIAMANSGEILDLSTINGIIVDKHSTGGVGDKVSLIVLPIIAACGVKVAKMSGRGLGFTGGTIDKLESIPGYNVNVSIKDFIQNVEKYGISLIAQTGDLAPADKKIYALRDAISCVDNIGLIASSIMSKKIASGANKIVLDVTVGKGAFMKTEEEATKLANKMIEIGKLANREVVCVLTKMDEPLGTYVGNSLEVVEAIKFLKGDMQEDLKEVVLTLGSIMIKLAGIGEDIQLNKKLILEKIENREALNMLKTLVQIQEGDIEFILDENKFEKAKYEIRVLSDSEGIITEINAEKVGVFSRDLGAGRITKEDQIDYSVGVKLSKKVGDKINVGDELGIIYTNKEKELEIEKSFKDIFKIEDIKNIPNVKSNIINIIF